MHKQVNTKVLDSRLSHMLNVILWIWYRDKPIWVKYVISEIISQAIYYVCPNIFIVYSTQTYFFFYQVYVTTVKKFHMPQ